MKPLISFSQERNVYFDCVNTWSNDGRWVASVFTDIRDGGFQNGKNLELELTNVSLSPSFLSSLAPSFLSSLPPFIPSSLPPSSSFSPSLPSSLPLSLPLSSSLPPSFFFLPPLLPSFNCMDLDNEKYCLLHLFL